MQFAKGDMSIGESYDFDGTHMDPLYNIPSNTNKFRNLLNKRAFLNTAISSTKVVTTLHCQFVLH